MKLIVHTIISSNYQQILKVCLICIFACVHSDHMHIFDLCTARFVLMKAMLKLLLTFIIIIIIYFRVSLQYGDDVGKFWRLRRGYKAAKQVCCSACHASSFL